MPADLRRMSVDATRELDELRRKNARMPISVVEYALWNAGDTERRRNMARMTVDINGKIFFVSSIEGKNYFDVLNKMFRESLKMCFGEFVTDSINPSSFTLTSRQENASVEVGMDVDSKVVVGFMASLEQEEIELPQTRKKSRAKMRENFPTTNMVRFTTTHYGVDIIDTIVKALCDGYNWFLMKFFSDEQNERTNSENTVSA